MNEIQQLTRAVNDNSRNIELLTAAIVRLTDDMRLMRLELSVRTAM